MTPILLIAPIPPKNERGTDKTRAQGHDTTKNTRALSIQSENKAPSITIGVKAKRQAAPTTKGVYQIAKRRIRASGFDLLAAASSIKLSNLVIDEFFDKVFTFKVMTLP